MGSPIGDRRLQVGQLACALLDEQVTLIVHERDPGRVVAAIFEAFEALDQDRAGLARSRVADDAAHAGGVLHGADVWSAGSRLV